MQAVMAWVRAHSTAVGGGLIAAAALAIAITALVVLRGVGDPSAVASPTPLPSTLPSASQTADASRTPGASEAPGPDIGHTWDGYQLTESDGPIFGGVWTRVVVDRLNVRDKAGTDGRIIGVAVRGDLLLVRGEPEYTDDGGWAPVVANGLAGWVAAWDGTTPYIRQVATPWLFGSPRVLNGMAALGDRILAYGMASDLSVLPYEGTGQRALVFSSADGRTWREAADTCCGPATAATSGGGSFVLAEQPSYNQPNLVQLSTDGVTWSEPQVIGFTAYSAAWGPGGAVLVGTPWGSPASAARVGSDGSVTELQLPPVEGQTPAVLQATSAGYVGFDQSATTLWISVDAQTWKTVAVPDADPNRQAVRDVELNGPNLIVVLADKESGATTLRYGRLGSTGQVTWEAQALTPFGSATVDSITLGGGNFLAFGWDRSKLLPHVWRSTDGRTWTDLGVDPGAFGGAIGPPPVFAGGRWYAATDAVYASTDGATWQEVFRPSVPPVANPGCPPADEVSTLELMFLGDLAADCYGDTPLTLTAWITVPEGLGGCCWPLGQPAWLNAPIPPGFLASGDPGAGFDFNRLLSVYPVPDLADEFQTAGPARVTGNFHDSAAQECRRIPLTWMPHRLESQSMVVAECERHFVVHEVVRSGS